MAKKKPFVPKEKTPIEALRAVAFDLECAAGVALVWLDAIAGKEKLPVARPELMAMLRKTLKKLEQWDKKHGTEEDA